MRYDSHLPALSLRDMESTHSILVETVLPDLQGTVICKNWHLWGSFWKGYTHKRMHIPTPPRGSNNRCWAA